MKKKIVGFVLACAVMFGTSCTDVSALTSWTMDGWTSGSGYGSVAKVDDNITNIKGETTAVDGMYVGPYSKASTQKLADGIQEEVYVELDPEKYANGEFFELSLGLQNAAKEYVSEATVMVQKDSDNAFHITSGWAPGFEAVIDEAGVYTIRYDMFIENGTTYVKVTVLQWDEVVATTGNIDMDTIVTGDTKNPVADHAVDVKYVWFCNVNVQDGVNVYTVLPEKPVVDPEPTPTPTPTPDTTVTENPNTGDSIMSYVVLAILGFGALGISSKKLLSE